MNSQTSHLPDSSQMGPVSEVLKLDCPFCQGTLNLRRIHLGIEGECVHCQKPVTAIEDDSGCRLVSSMGIPDSPFPEAASAVQPAEFPAAREVPLETLFGNSPVASPDAELVPAVEPVAEEAPQVSPLPAAEVSQSPWGFPSKETGEENSNQLAPISFSQIEPSPEPGLEPGIESLHSEPVEKDQPPRLNEEEPFQSASVASELFQKSEIADSEAGKSDGFPPPLPAQEEELLFGSGGVSPVEETNEVMDVSSQIVEGAGLFQSTEMPPPLEALEEISEQSPPPLEPTPEVPAVSSVPPALPDALNSSVEEVKPKSVTQSHPLPGGISPFSTGSAKRVEPGLAEALFTETVTPDAAPTPPPEAPDVSPPDDVAFNAANQWGPAAPVSKTADGDELDFSAIPQPSQDKAPAADKPVPTKIKRKRRSGLGLFKKVFKFFLTLGIIGGIIFAANTFIPAAKWSEWKQEAIDWLEPGSVILEKLPFGKNRAAGKVTPKPKVESATRTRQEISQELLQIPQRHPGG